MRRAVRVVVDRREKGEVCDGSVKADVGQLSIKVIRELWIFFLGKFSQESFFSYASSSFWPWQVARECWQGLSGGHIRRRTEGEGNSELISTEGVIHYP
jgi:hypothetical protein